MKKNMGRLDQIIRVVIALVIAGLWYTEVISGTIAIIGLIVAGIFIATSLINFCPLYWPFGLSTKKKEG